jgi:hypothetical protein
MSPNIYSLIVNHKQTFEDLFIGMKINSVAK